MDPRGVSTELSHRDRAILRAVARGTAELLVGVEPSLVGGYHVFKRTS
jgi:hypothetical protein